MAKQKVMKGVTKSGFPFAIEERRLKNYELLELVTRVDEDANVIPKLLTLLLGEDQKKALCDHVRDKDGFVDTEVLIAEIAEICNSNGAVKNSSSSPR